MIKAVPIWVITAKTRPALTDFSSLSKITRKYDRMDMVSQNTRKVIMF